MATCKHIILGLTAATTALALASSPALAQNGGARRITHVPENEVRSEGAELWFWASDPDRLGHIVVHVRPLDGGETTEHVAARGEEGWFVRLPEEVLPVEGIAYWVTERLPDGAERAVFASEEDPHEVAVTEPVLAAYERRRLAARDGRRHRAIAGAEYVSLGRREFQTPDGVVETSERYWRWEASYEHSFFWVADSVRLRVGQLRGDVARTDGSRVTLDEIGLDYGSAEVVWRVLDLWRFRTTVGFGFSQEGFEVGGGLDMIIGEIDGPSLTVGVDGMTTLGATGRLRLGWRVTPRLPMGATVEVTTFPVGDEPGMRLLLDAAYQFYPGAYLKLVGGYRGWTSTIGGPSLGLELALAF